MKLKIISDIQCSIYIDGELHEQACANTWTFINLEKGEYALKFVCDAIPSLTQEEDIFLEYDKVYRVNFLERLRDNSSLLESLRFERICNDDNHYGYQVADTDLMVIPCIYDNANEYWSSSKCGDIVEVSINGLWGIINKRGEFVLPADYLEVEIFNHYIYAYSPNGVRHIFTREYAEIYQDNEHNPDIESFYPKGHAYDSFISIGGHYYFPNGKIISDLEGIDLWKPLFYGLGNIDSPFCTAVKDSKWGIILIDPKKQSVKWITALCLDYRRWCYGPNDDPFCVPILDEPEWNKYSRHVFYNPVDRKEWIYTYYPELRVLVKEVSCFETVVLEPWEKKIELVGYENSAPQPRLFNVVFYNDGGEIIFERKRIMLNDFCGRVAYFWEDNNDTRYVVNEYGVITVAKG